MAVSLTVPSLRQPRRKSRLYLLQLPRMQGCSIVDIIKVSAHSRSTAVAGAIAGMIREHRRAEVQAIGAGAVNQAIKATAIARGYLEPEGIDIFCVPFFAEVQIDEQERTAIRLVIEPKK